MKALHLLAEARTFGAWRWRFYLMSLMLYDTILGNIFGVTFRDYPVRGGRGQVQSLELLSSTYIREVILMQTYSKRG